MKRFDSKGFTIVELLMAMAIFSFVMVIVVVAFTQLMRSYRQGVTSQKTQSLAREIIVDMTRIAHESNEIKTDTTGTTSHFCLGNVQYNYNSAANTLSQGNSADCTTPDASSEDLVGDGYQVLDFQAEPKSNASNTVQLGANISLTIATETDDLLTDTNACNPALAGSQFCSVTTINTAVGLRGE